MRTAEALFAGLFLVAAIVYEVMALGMPRGKLGYPGPGFFPLIVGTALILTTAACLLQTLLAGRAPGEAAAPPPAAEAAARSIRRFGTTGMLLTCLVVYILLLKPVGFPIAIGLFLIASIRAFGYRRWLPAVGIAAALTLVSYLSFVVWLKVPLPLGVLADLLE